MLKMYISSTKNISCCYKYVVKINAFYIFLLLALRYDCYHCGMSLWMVFISFSFINFNNGSRTIQITTYEWLYGVVLPYISNLNLVHWIPGNLAIRNFCSLLFDCVSVSVCFCLIVVSMLFVFVSFSSHFYWYRLR